ncbi:MAG TPA: deoxycytidine triphosphate deaminase [Candidatus Saccharimonadales bacterium]|nr:deoxycytidine triphosphate deaminase [Candidatus Saccharimonadales bacterium]
MAVYSDLEIKAELTAGHIVIHPLIEDNIRGSSVDVTLGEWFFTTSQRSDSGFYNPFDQADIARYFAGPFRAQPHAEWTRRHAQPLFRGIDRDQPIIVVGPGERVLAHTHEFIGINPPGTSELKSRSSWGRNGVEAKIGAGWGDPGYINRWTMQIHNFNPVSVPIPVGERIAQMIFYQTGRVERHYGTTGKYQGGAQLQELVASWSPHDMLPRAYKDSRHKPLPIDSVPD